MKNIKIIKTGYGYYEDNLGLNEIVRYVGDGDTTKGWIIRSKSDRFDYSDPIELLRDAKVALLRALTSNS